MALSQKGLSEKVPTFKKPAKKKTDRTHKKLYFSIKNVTTTTIFLILSLALTRALTTIFLISMQRDVIINFVVFLCMT